MHDLKQITKDAERVEASAKAWLSEYDLDRDEVEYHESERRVAAFARDLTDETPLTVEILAERGFKKDGVWWDRGNVRVGWTDRPVKLWAWYEMLPEYERVRIRPSPRTVGELTMLELLMEGR